MGLRTFTASSILVVTSLTTVLAGAHTGDACGPAPLAGGGSRLEAECYSSVLADTSGRSCDPDFDNEHTQAQTAAGASSGKQLFMPHPGCGVRFDDVDLGRSALASVRACPGGSAGTITLRLLLADEAGLIAGATVTGAGGACSTVAFEVASLISGSRDLSLTYALVTGPGGANLTVDYLDVLPRAPAVQITQVRYTAGPLTGLAQSGDLRATLDAHLSVPGWTQSRSMDLGPLVLPGTTLARSDTVWTHASCRGGTGPLLHSWVFHVRNDRGDIAVVLPRGVPVHSADSGVLATLDGTATDTFALVVPGVLAGTVQVTYRTTWVPSPCA